MNTNNVPVSILGKIIGGIIGLILFNLPGLIIGVIIGHLIDRHNTKLMPDNKVDQLIYIDSLFATLGYVAKLDGQISKQEINYASTIMQKMRLTKEQREKAMRAFYQGKREDFDVETTIKSLRKSAHHQRKLLYFFINAQIQMAYADGVIKEQIKPMLQKMAQQLGLMPLSFSYYDAIFGWQQRRQQHQYYQQHQQYQQYQHYQSSGQQHYQAGPRPQFTTTIETAYKNLGISSKITDEEVKKTYRKLMSKYHPDKLMSKGLSDKEMRAATEKVQQIKAAYEQIRQARGF